jgi:hypothetical protein
MNNKSIFKNRPTTTISSNNTPLVIIVICIFLTVACVMYAYKQYYITRIETQTSKEGFQTAADNNEKVTVTYSDVVQKLNTMKPLLESIKKAQSINIPFPDQPDVTKYISSSMINDPDVLREINSSFETNFSQKLQDSEINELSNELNRLKNKLASSNDLSTARPEQIKLKHISGSVVTTHGLGADAILGNTYNMLIGLSPNTGDCIMYNPDASKRMDKGIEKMDTLSLTQCDLSDNKMKFRTKTINNTGELNKILPESKKIPEYYNMINYPFMLVQPVNQSAQQLQAGGQMCLALSADGLSVEPCDGNTEQRFQIIQ